LKQKRIRVGVIGVGHLGEYHVQKYKGIAKADLMGIVDSDSARAELIAERYGTKVFRDHHDLLPQVDAVSLAVPTEKHYEVAKDVLSAGVHLLVEKPITYLIEPADTLIRMAQSRGLVLQVGLWSDSTPQSSKWKPC
jgi:predicted dehydrogenase